MLNRKNGFNGESLLLTVQNVLDYFQSFLLSKKVDLSTGIRTETPLFDFGAFRGAWINACVHNTWREAIPPAIYFYDDRLEIISYGGIPYTLTEKEFYKGVSKPVNRKLFDIFVACHFSEQTGFGVPEIIKTYGREAFSLEDETVVVSIPFNFNARHIDEDEDKRIEDTTRKVLSDKAPVLTEKQQNVIDYLINHSKATLQEVAGKCSLSIGGAKKIAGQLQAAGILERVGAKNNSTWIVKGKP